MHKGTIGRLSFLNHPDSFLLSRSASGTRRQNENQKMLNSRMAFSWLVQDALSPRAIYRLINLRLWRLNSCSTFKFEIALGGWKCKRYWPQLISSPAPKKNKRPSPKKNKFFLVLKRSRRFPSFPLKKLIKNRIEAINKQAPPMFWMGPRSLPSSPRRVWSLVNRGL